MTKTLTYAERAYQQRARQRSTIAALKKSLREMLDAYWGKGDGETPPKFITLAANRAGWKSPSNKKPSSEKTIYSILPLRRVTDGTILIADDGFTCMKDHSEHKVFRDHKDLCSFGIQPPMNSRSRLYVRCKEGRHHLDGQECDAGEHGMRGPHYIGFWIKGEQPPKGK